MKQRNQKALDFVKFSDKVNRNKNMMCVPAKQANANKYENFKQAQIAKQ